MNGICFWRMRREACVKVDRAEMEGRGGEGGGPLGWGENGRQFQLICRTEVMGDTGVGVAAC